MDEGLVGERVAQDLRFRPLGDQIAGLEIAEGDGERIGRHVRHVLGLHDRIAEQGVRLAGDEARLPQERPVRSLELADPRRGRRVHHERGALPVGRAQSLDEIDQLVLRVRRGEAARDAGRQILQRPEIARPVRVRAVRRGEKALGLARAVARDEGGALGPSELCRDLARQPGLDVERRIVEHRLARRRIGIELAERRRDLVERRRVRLRPRRRLRDPAAFGAAGRHQLAIAGRADLHDIGDRADRRNGGQRPVDLRVDLLRHRIAARGVGRPAHRLQLDAGLKALAQIALDEGRVLALRPRKRRPRPGNRLRIHPRLQRGHLAAQRRHILILPLERLERSLQRIRLHFQHLRLLG